MNKNIIIAVITLALGFGAGYWLAGKQQGQGMDSTTEGAAKGDRKVLFYRNPMNPAITSPTPAKDDMGMDYIPVYAEGGSGKKEPAGTVTIDPVTVQDIGVRTARVIQRPLSREIHAVARWRRL